MQATPVSRRGRTCLLSCQVWRDFDKKIEGVPPCFRRHRKRAFGNNPGSDRLPCPAQNLTLGGIEVSETLNVNQCDGITLTSLGRYSRRQVDWPRLVVRRACRLVQVPLGILAPPLPYSYPVRACVQAPCRRVRQPVGKLGCAGRALPVFLLSLRLLTLSAIRRRADRIFSRSITGFVISCPSKD
jgi:hypothetical protein